MSTPARNDRIAWVDLARAVAMMGVVAIHTAGQAMVTPPGFRADDWEIGNAVNALARLAVPLFFMVSGTLLLGPRDEPVGAFLKRRLTKIAIPFGFWSLFYIAWRTVFRGEWPAFSDFASVLWQPAHYHLWFFYSILGLYLITPLLRSFLRDKGGRYLAGLWLLTIPLVFALQTFSPFRLESNFRVLPTYLGYFVGGYLLKDVLLAPGQTKWALFALLAGWAATAAGNHTLAFIHPIPESGYFTDFLSLNVLVMGVAAFLLLRKLGEWMGKQSGPGLSAVRLVADCGLGIYVIHPAILDGLRLPGLGISAFFVHPLLGIPLTFGLALILSVGIVSLIKRVPFLRATV
ncbi:MAG: acyltransferase family protein [Spirochaetes bacterium]|nr:acyltransferase family protein [Spirochaetota bacterium]